MSWSGYAGDSVKNANALAARAKAGDQGAMHLLAQAAGQEDNPATPAVEGWSPDHRNAAIDAWNSLGMGPPVADIKNPHKGFLGGLGSFLKFAAPIGAMLIPGIGPLGAAAIGAGGSAAGGMLHGDKFNLLKTALAGAAGAAGNKFLGNGLGSSGIPGAPYVPGLDPGMSGGAAGSGGGGIGGMLKGALGIGGPGGPDLSKILATVGTIGGGISAANAQNKANQERNAAIGGANQEWQSRAPLRAAAQSGMLSLGQIKRPDLSSMFGDVGNPYSRPVQPLGAGY